ncbi:Sec-independent protein translocase protein TatB [uncultured Parasphingorhabdus sp.]|uniref:Sec-independent protein translocase protein TatB n=1 Tax=uncultured Parasphingorhabdus sp. TaxID=2709694 RepID=UPI002AA746FB|nr:Sec-independent protein translocase protein TatB [uncultured Parasphingorhabdus sp.]
MFDLSISEIAIIAIIAVVVIGPKELPRALSTAGKWMAKGRGIMANFRTGLDAMVREAELQEMEKKWASENERIMREHPALPDESAVDEPVMEPLDGPSAEAEAEADTGSDTGAAAPVNKTEGNQG